MLAYAVPPAIAIFGVAIFFWRRANANGATVTWLLGSFCGFGLFLINSVLRWTHFHFLYAAPLLTAIDCLILIVVSLQSPSRHDVVRDATMWQPK